MREYGKINGDFWIKKPGKLMCGKPAVQITALYLLTNSHANMIGVYHCPPIYISHETGLSLDDVSSSIRDLEDMDFCSFEWENEYVFIHEFSTDQVGKTLSTNDNRLKGVLNQLALIPDGICKSGFIRRYATPYNLQPHLEKESSPNDNLEQLPRLLEAPSKPGAGAGAGAGKISGMREGGVKPSKVEHATPRFLITNNFEIPSDWESWAESERRDIEINFVFKKFLVNKSAVTTPQTQGQWFADWQLWVLNERLTTPMGRAQQATTVPGAKGKCAALRKIEADAKITAPPSREVREDLAALRRKYVGQAGSHHRKPQ